MHSAKTFDPNIKSNLIYKVAVIPRASILLGLEKSAMIRAVTLRSSPSYFPLLHISSLLVMYDVPPHRRTISHHGLCRCFVTSESRKTCRYHRRSPPKIRASKLLEACVDLRINIGSTLPPISEKESSRHQSPTPFLSDLPGPR